ncbi:peroxiredoxin family protein [Pseudonocardia humida]|uniref:Redoxin domain-containing protein n=1 Tax=Pseudonocardia humida TaxID=2800819 RepID=A0ABT1A2M9_9PSEU|nr:redoxin domain-containing protein [Pseudonocardia humida]MCO1657170.1 redoxin domain-containing protein [Pseudonocardia humida]
MLVAIVVLLAMLVLANMLLTWGMLRRLRALQDQVGAGFAAPVGNGLHPGDRAPDFSALTPAGDTVTRDEVVRGETVLVFLSPHCEACETHLPSVRELGRGARAAVAVVDGTREESGHLVDGLRGDVPVLFAPRAATDMLERYRVNSYPSSYVVGADGRITGSHLGLDELLPTRT